MRERSPVNEALPDELLMADEMAVCKSRTLAAAVACETSKVRVATGPKHALLALPHLSLLRCHLIQQHGRTSLRWWLRMQHSKLPAHCCLLHWQLRTQWPLRWCLQWRLQQPAWRQSRCQMTLQACNT